MFRLTDCERCYCCHEKHNYATQHELEPQDLLCLEQEFFLQDLLTLVIDLYGCHFSTKIYFGCEQKLGVNLSYFTIFYVPECYITNRTVTRKDIDCVSP